MIAACTLLKRKIKNYNYVFLNELKQRIGAKLVQTNNHDNNKQKYIYFEWYDLSLFSAANCNSITIYGAWHYIVIKCTRIIKIKIDNNKNKIKDPRFNNSFWIKKQELSNS